MAENQNKQIIYYDDYCNLCLASVRFIRKNDRHDKFSFVPLQNMNQKTSSCDTNSTEKILPETIILKGRRKTYEGSDAVLQIMKELGFPWNTFYIFIIIPRNLRDKIYRFIAHRRYRWFGKKEQ